MQKSTVWYNLLQFRVVINLNLVWGGVDVEKNCEIAL